MSVERHPGSLRSLADDTLGAIAVTLAVSEATWTPDVAPAVLDRVSRDAVAYPEHFDRRPAPARPHLPTFQRPDGSGLPLLRMLLLALVVAVAGVIVLVVGTAEAARAASAELEGLSVDLVPVAEGLEGPVHVTAAGDAAWLYVVEQAGLVRIVEPDGSVAQEPFLDLRDAVITGYEQGLLGLAFHPDFEENGRLFVDYTRAGDGATVISEFQARDGAADRESERVVLVIEQPYPNHNGGTIAFDAQGYLLIGTGDGGGAGDPLGSGQDPASLLGKLLRIDVDATEPYAIPPDNGFASSDRHRPEIHAMGLRNPWRFSVDRAGGHVYIGDVGQHSFEEVDVLPGGEGGLDFGWNRMEGRECYVAGCDPAAHAAPAIAYGRDDGCTVVGGHAYRGDGQAALQSIYIFGDYCSGTIWGARVDDLLEPPAEAVELGRMDGSLVAFGVDDAGEIYAVDQGGRILHLVGEVS